MKRYITGSGSSSLLTRVLWLAALLMGASSAAWGVTITASCPAPSAIQGQSYYFAVSATGVAPLTWTLYQQPLPPGLSLNSPGVITGTPTTTGTFPISVLVTDSTPGNPQSAVYSCNLVVTPPVTALTITAPCPAPSGVVGTPYSFSITATGGMAPLHWQLGESSLPPGLSLNPLTGLIQGTPTAAGNYPISIFVYDSQEQYAFYNCQISIASAPVFTISSSCPQSGQVGTSYSFAVAVSGAQNVHWALTSGPLPPGLTLNTNTGVISGTPTTAGSYPFVISVSLIGGNSAPQTLQCTLVIAAAPQPVEIGGSCPSNSIAAGSAISLLFYATGGVTPYTWTIGGNSGLSPANSSGPSNTITGTAPATPGSYTLSIGVTDAGGSQPANLRCTLVIVSAPLRIGGSCPASAFPAGSPVSIPFNASGGAPPYAWTLGGNSGLSLTSSTGAANTVTGTAPATPGSYAFTISVTDGGGSPAASLPCTVIVQSPTSSALQITGTCPAATLDLPLTLSVALNAAGGQAPYTWTLTGPSWLALSAADGSATVANTGAPNAAGPFSFTAMVSDSSHSTPATFTCTSSINTPTPPTIVLSALPPSSGSPLQPTSITLQLSAPALLPISGVVQLSFAVNAFGETDNPQVAFDGGGRTASFTIAAGQSSFTLPNIQQGTVAGTIHVEIVALTQGTDASLPVPHPFTDLVIARQAPVIDVTFSNETASGFDVVIAGYSTPRDMKSVTVTFTAAQGANLGGSPTVSFTIDISALFTQYYSSAASQLVGSLFQNFHIPIAIGGDKTAIGSVSVTMANSVGNSPTVTTPR